MSELRTSASVTLVNVVGQVASFGLFAVIAYLYGADASTDAFFLALAVPTLLVGPLANAIHSVVVPMFTASRVTTPEETPALARVVVERVSAVSLIACLLLYAAVPWALQLMDLSESERMSVRTQSSILLPMVLLQTLSAVLQAILNAEGQFVRPALAFAFRHLTALVVIAAMHAHYGVSALAPAFSVGALAQFAWLLWQARHLHGGAPVSARRREDLQRGLHTAAPVIASAMILQGGAFVLRAFASALPDGSVTVFDYASRITSGVVELTSSGVLLVVMVRWSELVARAEWEQLRQRVRDAVSIAIVVLVPIAALMATLSPDVIAVLLGRGHLDERSIALTSVVLAILALTIPVEIVGRLYLRFFLAGRTTRLLTGLALLRLVSLVLGALALTEAWGVRGLTIAETFSVLSYVSVLAWFTGRKLGGTVLPQPAVLIGAVIGGLAAAGLAWWIRHLMLGWPSHFAGPIAAAAGCGIYLAMMWRYGGGLFTRGAWMGSR